MGEFMRRVQADEVPGPLQRKFTPEHWKKALAAVDAPDEADKDLYSAGLAIFEKMNNIRALLKLSTSSTLTASTKLRAFVAAANHNFLLAREKTREAIAAAGEKRAELAPDGFRVEQLLDVKLELPNGFKASPDEVLEGLVDGVEVPVKVALQTNPDLSGNPKLDQVKWGDISIELNLGMFFRYAEDLWDDCLWNGYRLVEAKGRRLFMPTDMDLKRGHAMGVVRRQALGMQFAITSSAIVREMAARGRLPVMREVKAIAREGRRQVIKLGRGEEFTKAQEEFALMRGYASEPYYSELLGEELPTLGGLRLIDVLNAWVVVSQASLVLVDSVAKSQSLKPKEDAPPHTWLPDYVPVLQVGALVEALTAAAGINPAAGKKLVEFLTYKGEAKTEIWAKPLVPVGPSTVAPLFAAVVSPNLRRLIDIWMRYAGVDMARRGPAFEAHIRADVVEGIGKSKVLAGHAAAVPEDYTFTPPGQQGVQFDLVFVIGSTVLIAETKCILEPTEAKGIANHRKTVMEAADQVLLRQQVLQANRERFIADMKTRFGIDVPDNFTVVSFIVVSTATHVGVPAKGVPVVDQYILNRFLEGELDDIAVRGENHEVVRTVKNVFFTSVEEAQSRAAQYFAAPPQLQRLIKGVSGRIVPLPAVSEGDWDALVAVLQCQPTELLMPSLADAVAEA